MLLKLFIYFFYVNLMEVLCLILCDLFIFDIIFAHSIKCLGNYLLVNYLSFSMT